MNACILEHQIQSSKGYTDSDMAGDLDNRKSTAGYLFTFSGEAISWQSKLQKSVTLSTTEAEYIAATEAGKEMIWLKRFLQELGLNQMEYIVYCDSQSAIDLSKNSMFMQGKNTSMSDIIEFMRKLKVNYFMSKRSTQVKILHICLPRRYQKQV